MEHPELSEKLLMHDDHAQFAIIVELLVAVKNTEVD